MIGRFIPGILWETVGKDIQMDIETGDVRECTAHPGARRDIYTSYCIGITDSPFPGLYQPPQLSH